MAAPGTAASGTTAALSPAPPGLAPRPGALHPSPRVSRPPRTIGPSVWRRCAGWPWALPVVLCVQAVLSLRLIRVNTAFQDEALYLWAGHMEWSHWLHGTSIPLYATYFSGAPVLYPPLGALADSLGGLVGARLLSLGFMLVATAALWGTTSRLYGRRAAFFAAALWAVLGPTLHLGVFATYDAMSLCLLAVAAWCAVHAGPRRDETGWMAVTAAALVLANATKYASALFDPVVVAIVILNAWSLPAGSKAALSRGAALAAYVTSGAILLVTVGGGYYEAGIGQTTLTRTSGTDSPMLILGDSWSWSMTVVIAALVGVAVALVTEKSLHRRLVLAVLAGAASLVPVEQARIHTLTSLDKHVDFGAWFAAIAAGYAASKLIDLWRRRWLRAAATVVIGAALLVPAQRGAAQGLSLVRQWPNATRFYHAFGQLAAVHPGRFLVETPSIPEYYLPLGAHWQLWSNTRSVVLPSGHSISAAVNKPGNPSVYARFIGRDYFSLVALDFYATRVLDHEIAADLNRNPRYRVVADVPYGNGRYTFWARTPAASHARVAAHPPHPARSSRAAPSRSAVHPRSAVRSPFAVRIPRVARTLRATRLPRGEGVR